MSRDRIPAAQRAREGWHGDPPDWVLVLAEEIDRQHSQKKVADAIGWAAGTVSQVVSNTYRGRLDRIEQSVRGEFMGATVDCPVMGEIGRQKCLAEQRKPLTFENPLRPRVYRACRSGCPHSRLTPHAAGTTPFPSTEGDDQ